MIEVTSDDVRTTRPAKERPMIRRHDRSARPAPPAPRSLSVVLAVGLLAGLAVLTGCEDDTGPLIRTGTLSGVVRDAAGAYVAGVPVAVIYDLPTPPVAKAAVDGAAAPPAVPAGLEPLDTVDPIAGVFVERNYPNPFADQTTLRFGLPDSGRANLTLLDARGDSVATLVDATLDAGLYAYHWSPQDGPPLPNGYALALLRLTTGGTERTSYLYGMLHNAADPAARSANDLTDGVGEFDIPLAKVASGSLIALTTGDGPTVVDRVRVPDVVRVEIDHDGSTNDITVHLADMSAWYYLEFLLP
jgi:hypothetical protein